MSVLRNKRLKDEVRELMQVTRPPRLEGDVKEAKMQPVKKHRKRHEIREIAHKPQGYTEHERKDYQLRSNSH